MSVSPSPRLLQALMSAVLFVFLSSGLAARSPDVLEELLVQPAMTGQAPAAMAWNADGSALAFAWNAAGESYRDLYLHRPGAAQPQRLTRLADEGRRGAGVRELAWLAGNRIAFIADGALYALDLSSGQVVTLESGVAQIRNLQASPDGQQLAFTSGGAANSYRHEYAGDGSLWLRDASAAPGTDSRRVFGDPDPKVYVDRYEWSADGRRIALLEADNRPVPERDIHYHVGGGELKIDRVVRAFPGEPVTKRRLGVLDVAAGDVRWFERDNGEHPIWNFGLSADGSRVFANISDDLVKQHTVMVYDVASGRGETFYSHHDAGNVVPGWRVAWAPGDQGLVVLTDRDGYYHLYHVAEAGAAPRAITSGAWEITGFDVDAAGKQLYFTANRDHVAERQLYRVAFTGGDIERLTPQAGHWSPQFAPDFSQVALIFSDDVTPPDLYARALKGSADIARVTASPLPSFADYDWADVRYIEYPSHVDGQTVIGRLQVPRDFDPKGRYPLIVGSIYSDTVLNQWARDARPNWAFDQYLVAQGYLVLKVNVRGSRGQGRVFSGGLLHDYGGIDTDDIESVVRGLIADGTVDERRVGIWGNSYGGLMTLMSLFKKPGLYAAGIAGAPATNVWHAYPSQMWVMGEPEGEDFPARYERQSALYHSAGLADPLMIIHGTQDPIVLYSDTVALVERMIAQAKNFELVTVPGGSHGWMADNPQQTLFAYRKMLDFFSRHVMNRP